MAIEITPSTDSVLLDERWDSAWLSRWRQFGDPFPSIVTVGGERAFWNAGDGNYNSGAYTQRTFDPSRGLTLEADVAVPSTPAGEEMLHVELTSAQDSAVKANWDHRTGYYLRGPNARMCGMEYPVGTSGPTFGAALNLPVGSAPATPAMRAGKRFHVTLQILPDGRCRGVIDHAVARNLDQIGARNPVRVAIYGSSVHTKVLVYRLTLRQGAVVVETSHLGRLRAP
jgi:hypothetical protein